MLDAGKHRRVADLVAIEVQDGQHGSVADRVEELVGLPRRGQRPRFSLAIADDAGDVEIGIIEDCPEGMAERVPQLAAFVDRTWAFRRGMAGNAAGKRKLQKQFSEPGLILTDIRVDLAVGTFEIGVAYDGRPAVPRAGDVDHVEVVFLDDPVQMHVDEVLAGGRSPASVPASVTAGWSLVG